VHLVLMTVAGTESKMAESLEMKWIVVKAV